MVTRKLIRIKSPEAAALLAAKETSLSSSAAEDSTTVNKQPPTLLTNGSNSNSNDGGKERDLRSEDAIISGRDSKKRRRTDGFVIDLTDVPPQLPILKRKGRIKEGGSKYVGVSFHKANKWKAQIMIEGKEHHIGLYENEEEAAIDYARAIFMYKGQEALDKAREQNSYESGIDLSDVPPQQPIPKIKGHIKEGSSNYIGVFFDKSMSKWMAKVSIEGKQRFIGYYINEEEAAIDYARAVFKYKGKEALDKARERKSSGSAISIDLRDVPPQLPIPKSKGYVKEGSSKYTGVFFDEAKNKWRAQITIDGKQRCIGYYENEGKAAVDYAKAAFKYRGQEALDKAREQNSYGSGIDLSDVPPQPPIRKSKFIFKEGASIYTGVTFDKNANKWQAQIQIDGKNHYIGLYENEEEAAINYARAVFKYKGQEALDKARERKKSASAINIELDDVPSIPPILKSKGSVGEGSSRYAGVSFNKAANKWKAEIIIEGKQYSIGYYENEVFAAIDYARAVLKYQGQRALDKARGLDSVFKNTHISMTHSTNTNNDEENGGGKKRALPLESGGSITNREIVMKRIMFHLSASKIDLSDVPPQQPILKNEGRLKEGASRYVGVCFDKSANKWQAKIMIEGKKRHIGTYESEEEAAADYARAIFKYKGEAAAVYARSVNR